MTRHRTTPLLLNDVSAAGCVRGGARAPTPLRIMRNDDTSLSRAPRARETLRALLQSGEQSIELKRAVNNNPEMYE